jgi:hypothetical protein
MHISSRRLITHSIILIIIAGILVDSNIHCNFAKWILSNLFGTILDHLIPSLDGPGILLMMLIIDLNICVDMHFITLFLQGWSRLQQG